MHYIYKHNYSNSESQKNTLYITYGALIGNYRKVYFILGMYVLLNQVAFFISSKTFMR